MDRLFFPSVCLTIASMAAVGGGHHSYEFRPKPPVVSQHKDEASGLSRLIGAKNYFEETPELNNLYSKISEPLDEIILSRKSKVKELKESPDYREFMESSPFENNLFKYGVIGFAVGLGGLFSGIPFGFWDNRRMRRELAELEESGN